MDQVEAKPFQRNPRFTYTHHAQGGISGEVLIGGVDTERGFKVAIKQPHSHAAPEIVERHADNIVRETKALEILQGVPGVCTLLAHDAEPTPDMPDVYAYAYVVMTFAEGKPLEDWIKEYHQVGAEFPWLEVLLIFEKLTALLAEAHNRGLVHNDVDIKQIFWERETKTLTLIDWGNVVFFKEEENGARPQADIRQVGEALYKVITQMDVGSARTAETLSWGTAIPPARLKNVIVKALFGGNSMAGREPDLDASYTDMASLHSDIESLYSAAYAELKDQLDAFWNRAQNPESQSPLEELQALKGEISAWPARQTLPQQVQTLSDAIDNKLRKLQEQFDWQEARICLETGEFDKALPILQHLRKKNARIENVDLEFITETCELFVQNPGPENQDLAIIFESLLKSDPRAAFEIVMSQYHKTVQSYRDATDRAPALIVYAAYPLTRKLDLGAVRLYLEWLERKVENEEKRLSNDRTQKQRRRKLVDASAALTELIDRHLYCPSIADLSSERMRKTYTQVHEKLKDIGKNLKDLDYPKLAALAELMQQQAQKITELLEPMFGTSRNVAAEVRHLEEAYRLDPSNPDLGELHEILTDVLNTWERWQHLNNSRIPSSWDEFEALYHEYKSLGLSDNPQLRGLRQQWTNFEREFLTWSDSKPESTEFSPYLLRSAEPLPPLHRFLELQAKKTRATEKSTSATSSATTELSRLPAQETTRDTDSLGARNSFTQAQSDSETKSSGTPQYGSTESSYQGSNSRAPVIDASGISNSQTANSGVSPTPSSPDTETQEIKSLLQRGNYREALMRLRNPKGKRPRDLSKIYSQYKEILEIWNAGIDDLINGEFATARKSLSASPSFLRDWSVLPNGDLGQVMYQRLIRLCDEVARISVNWQQIEQNQSGTPWENMTETLQDAEKVLTQEGVSTTDIAEQIRLHKSVKNAYLAKNSSEYNTALKNFRDKYPKHVYLTAYERYTKFLGASVSPGLPTSRPMHPYPSQLTEDKSSKPPDEPMRGPGFGMLEWVVIAMIIVVCIAIVALVIAYNPNKEENPISTPRITRDVITPTLTPSLVAKTMLDYCRGIEASIQTQDWEAALKGAETARTVFKADFGSKARTISQDCNLQTSIGQAGKELVLQQYNAEQYEQAIEIADRTLKLLQELAADTSTPSGEWRSLDILQQCAVYQQVRVSDPAKATEALASLEHYKEGLGSFYSEFETLCGLGNYDNLLSDPDPTPISVPCEPVLPVLISPEENAQVSLADPIHFQWEGGNLCPEQVWLVTINGRDDICEPTIENSQDCMVRLDEWNWNPNWRVEIRDAENPSIVIPGMMTQPRRFFRIP